MQDKLKKEIRVIRGFNRYYTNVLGLLNQHLLESEFSLSEVRVLHEIDKTENCTIKFLMETLCMDSGYLSRIIKRFQKCGLLEKKRSPEDKRSQYLNLTDGGKGTMDRLNARSDEQIRSMIEPLPETGRSRLAQNMTSIEAILTGGKSIRPEDITIRHHIKSGDAGYITYMHGWIYREEYGYTTAFEAYVAQSFTEFLLNYDAGRDRLWVAEHNGQVIGSIGVVGHGDRAQLRWFLLHPCYRGLGLGKKLLDGALDFCREAGYKTAYLDTTGDLEKAIGMYRKAGFALVSEKENHTWKDDLTELEFAMAL